MSRFITLNNGSGKFTTNFTNELTIPLSLEDKLYEVTLKDFIYKKSDKVQLGELNLEYFNLKVSIPISCDHGESFEAIFKKINDDLNTAFIKLEYSRRFGIYVQNFLKESSEINYYENNKKIALPRDNNVSDLTVLQDIVDSVETCRLNYDKQTKILSKQLPKKLYLYFNGLILQYLDTKNYYPNMLLKRTHIHSLDVVHVLCDLIEYQNAHGLQLLQTIRINSNKHIKQQFKKVLVQGDEVESINIRLVDNLEDMDWDLYLGDVIIVLRLLTNFV